jgi:hypothetical protein
MIPSIIDMHIHTTRGAADSSLRPIDLARVALRRGLSGVLLTEHDRLWDAREIDEFQRRHGLSLFGGMEVSTDLGHIIVVGLDRYLSGVRYAEELRRIATDAGAYLIVAHPFRQHFSRAYWEARGLPPFELEPPEAARLPVFELVDAIEVLNGGNTAEENTYALEVARILGKPGIAGSDAHSEQGIGIYTTVFESEIDSQSDLLRELRAGRFYPAHGLPEGNLQPFTAASQI